MAGIFYPGNENKPNRVASIKKSLWEYWEIQGHESAMDTMTRLVHSGMVKKWKNMKQYIMVIQKKS